MTDNTRPKPASYGFDLDFNNLAKTQPSSMAAKVAEKQPKAHKSKTVDKASSKPTDRKKAQAVKPRKKNTQQKHKINDEIAAQMGFTSREAKPAGALLKKRRRTHHDEPVDQLSIRGPVRVLNDFITFCDQQGLAYWQGLEDLMSQNSSK